jgi:16S rRNA (uracil1498-N3)-methyltransferase
MLDEDRSGSPLAAQEVAAGDSAALLLGPEGGWTEQERAAAREGGWKPVTIAANVLRAETAALAGLALAGQLFARR